MNVKKVIKDAFVLFAITLVLGLALSGAKVVTEPLIIKAADDAKIKAFNQVCSEYSSSENITADVVGASAGYNASLNGEEGVLRARNKDGEPIGYIVQCNSKGYGGLLNLIVGFDLDGKITGIAFANTPSETPGLGMKVTKKKFIDTWLNHSQDDINDVDTITGATISSKAFKEAVSMACMFANRAKTMDGR